MAVLKAWVLSAKLNGNVKNSGEKNSTKAKLLEFIEWMIEKSCKKS